MSVSNMPPIDRAEQSTAHEIQQAKVIDLNDRVLNLDNPDDKNDLRFCQLCCTN